jgi:hypothetical protein
MSLAPAEIAHHLYVLGGSGGGKSKFLELLVRLLILHDVGFCLLDPHGDLTQNVLAFLYEEAERRAARRDPISLDRAYLYEAFEPEVIGLNPLDPGSGCLYPHVSTLVGAFRRSFSSSWGPHVETLTRNAFLTLAYAGKTLADAPRLLTDSPFRGDLLRRVTDPAVRDYWTRRFDTLGDAPRRALVESLLSKLEGGLIADPRLRAMLAQERTPNLRRLMDSGAWLLFNLSKGQLRESSSLLGSLVVAQLQTAALSRADQPESERRPFVLLADEFQNFQGDDFEMILSEARKYRLSLVLAHQATAQVGPSLLASVFSNVGTQVFFALSPQDAAAVSRGFSEGSVAEESLVHLPRGSAVLRRRGKPAERVQVLPVHTPAVDPPAVDAFRRSLRSQHVSPAPSPEALPARPSGPVPPAAVLQGSSVDRVREADDD